MGHSLCTCLSKVGSFSCAFVVISPLTDMTVGALLCGANVAAAMAAWCLPDTTGVGMGKVKIKLDRGSVDDAEKMRVRLLDAEDRR